jgi:tRNA wybutosine-synthesizing protein 2
MNDYEFVALIVKRPDVKKVKNLLEKRKLFNKELGIEKYGDSSLEHEDLMKVSTLLPHKSSLPVQDVLKELGVHNDVEIVDVIAVIREDSDPTSGERQDRLKKVIELWLSKLSPDIQKPCSLKELTQEIPSRYMIYQPMLLLLPTAFTSPQWQTLLNQVSEAEKDSLFSRIADRLKVTHIARNAPIPLHLTSEAASTSTEANILRSPINITPLYGDFGPTPPLPHPTSLDFNSALWVSTSQNAIMQIWAPLHTMFSRGNISEKTRILQIARAPSTPFSAVDLYAGIGYFAFSYVAGGASNVLGWEINPWSIEGMRRGAVANGWSVSVAKENAARELMGVGSKVTIFQMDNASAVAVVNRVRSSIPPVRHVNCGFLPTSKGSWETAVAVVDPVEGGWVHLHENFRAEEIAQSVDQVLGETQSILDRGPCASGVQQRVARLDHVVRVKSYAPGVIHCVLDIYIDSIKS